MPADRISHPWRYSTQGISVALRVTPRGGRDEIDGIETLADGRSVVKVRVRAIAEGGGANRAVDGIVGQGARSPQSAGPAVVRRDLAAQADRGGWRSRGARRRVTKGHCHFRVEGKP